MKKIRFLTILAAAFFVITLLSLSTCKTKEAKEVKIGIVAPITGEAAAFGISAKKGAILYFDAINESGGIDGMMIKYIVEDDRGDPAEGANAYSKLIGQDKVSVICGTVMSKVSLAGALIAQGKGVPMVSPTSTNPAVTLVGDYIFRACFIDPFQGFVAARYAIDTVGAGTAAALYDAGNDYTRGLAGVFRAEFPKLGGKIVAFESYATGTTDFNPQLVKIKKVNPDVLFLPNYYNDSGLIARQAREMGITAQLLGSDGWDSPDLIKIAGDSINGGVFVNHFTTGSDLPAAQKFVRDYEAEFGQKPNAMGALAYEAAMIIVEAIKNAGSTDSRAIRDALAATNMETITGTIRYDENRNPVKGAVILEIKDGKIFYLTSINP
ncbi:MAG: ABC transporter substrate-binding protein [Spirochaeta sp.]|nr:ABC transporter substrate-binding protein [Spirochaeta sp.]